MADNPIEPTDFLSPESGNGINDSMQDRRINRMTLDELRKWRIETAKRATQQGSYARSHNKYLEETVKDLQEGERLSDRQLNELIKSARLSAGIAADELIEFTLGNTRRNNELKKVMNAAVINAYLANVKKAANQFSGGITPQAVINNSHFADIKRANKQIFLASVYKRQGNVFYFVTNAGPDSKDTHHYVTVQLLDYPKLLMGTKPPSISEVKKIVKEGNIRFDCDCGRHRYWYRYLATVGKYNFGIDENRYPSTRNPNSTGLACKHVLRVMNHLQSGMMLQQIKNYARDDIAKANNQVKSQRRSPKQLQREAAEQTRAINNWNGRLHWAKQVKRTIVKAQKQVKNEMKKQAKARPNEPTQAEKASYQYAKKQLNKKGVPDTFKKLYQTEIDNYQSKWGRR